MRTFRITEPQNYAHTVFIEALEKAGVKIHADPIAANPAAKLPPRDSYTPQTQLAELRSPPYAQYASWILKVSYNIGADTSLVLFGLTQHADSMPASLAAEQKTLAADFQIPPTAYHFFDGSGGGTSAVTPTAVTHFLRAIQTRPCAKAFEESLPILATDGSLAFVTDFTKDPTLAGAKGQVAAKTGTYMLPTAEGQLNLKAQTLAGYIKTKRGHHLAYALFVNDVPKISGIEELLGVFQDQGTVSAILWRDN